MILTFKIYHDQIASIKQQFTGYILGACKDFALDIVVEFEATLEGPNPEQASLGFIETSIKLYFEELDTIVLYDFNKLSTIDKHKIRMRCIESIYDNQEKIYLYYKDQLEQSKLQSQTRYEE